MDDTRRPGLIGSLVLLLALSGGVGAVQHVRPLDVLIIGDTIPDASFFYYDPSLTYKVLPYPSWAQSWTSEETDRWLNLQEAARSLVPADFIIELPYAAYGNQAIDSQIRLACADSIIYRGASFLLPVPATPLLAHLAPDETYVETSGMQYATKLERQNRDALGAMLSTQFSVAVERDPLMGFVGLIEGYHDANLFLMEEPRPLAQTVATISPRGSLGDTLGVGRPWLVRLNLSQTSFGFRLGAKGYVWKCASPLNGVFFFPQGGYVATSVVSGAGYVHVEHLKIGETHEYAWDVISHIILYSHGQEIPDLVVAHQARVMFARYYTEYADSYHALEMADMASSFSQTYPVWVDLAQLAASKREAADLYRSGDVEASRSMMGEVLPGIQGAKRRAERALRTSLFAIHLAEYVAVSATLLVSVSVVMYFVSAPRTRIAASTRYDVEGKTVPRSIPVWRGKEAPWPKALLIVIVVIVVATPGVVLFWGQLSRAFSWRAVYADAALYREIPEDAGLFEGKLVFTDWSLRRVIVDESQGTARVMKEDEAVGPGSVVVLADWPLELEREGLPSILVRTLEGDGGFRLLRSYVGLKVEIKGKLRTPRISVEGKEYRVSAVLELVPGAIREMGEGEARRATES